MEALGLIANIVTAIGSIAIAVLVYRFTRRQATIEMTHEMRTAWMAVDQVAIGNPQSLRILSEIAFGEFDEKTACAKWHALLAMNPVVTGWQLGQHGIGDRELVLANDRGIIQLLRSPLIQELVLNTDIYEEAFRQHCKQLLSRQAESEQGAA
jgi:hypothetical protein